MAGTSKVGGSKTPKPETDDSLSWGSSFGRLFGLGGQSSGNTTAPAPAPSSKVARPTSVVKYKTATDVGSTSPGYKFGGKYAPYTGGDVPKGYKIGSGGPGGKFLVPDAGTPDTAAPPSKRVRNPTTKTTKTITKSQPQQAVTRTAATAYGGPESNHEPGYTTSRSYGRNPKIGKSSAIFGRGNLAAHGASHDTKGLKFFRGKD